MARTTVLPLLPMLRSTRLDKTRKFPRAAAAAAVVVVTFVDVVRSVNLKVGNAEVGEAVVLLSARPLDSLTVKPLAYLSLVSLRCCDLEVEIVRCLLSASHLLQPLLSTHHLCPPPLI